MIQVNYKNSNTRTGFLGVHQRLGKTGVEERSVGQLRQRIVKSQMLHCLLCFLSGGDVEDHPGNMADRARRVVSYGLSHDADPDPVSIAVFQAHV